MNVIIKFLFDIGNDSHEIIYTCKINEIQHFFREQKHSFMLIDMSIFKKKFVISDLLKE